MEKIPTLFVRDENDRAHVTDEVTPGCEWVIAGEGIATRKYDGTCVMFDGENWWRRRELKKDKVRPEGFVFVSFDPITLKTVGWVPMDPQGFFHPFLEALGVETAKAWRYLPDAIVSVTHEKGFEAGTYELIGPKINGNPEGITIHRLVKHSDAEKLVQNTYSAESIKDLVKEVGFFGYEGIVWQHPDGRMAKLKVKDLK
jgi:hypothetical protein